MPRGFDAVQTLSKRSAGGVGPLRLRLKDGESAKVRFLEQGDDIFYYYYHDFSHIDKDNGFKYSFPCLDQEDEGKPSPGNENDFPRKFKTAVNVIWRDAPDYERDSDGKIVVDGSGNWKQIGTRDQVAVWEGGPSIYQTLAKKDLAYKGLASRDLEITRTGTGFDTRYAVEPADIDSGPVAPTEEDIALAKDKYDLEKVARLDMTYDEVKKYIDEKLGTEEGSSDVDDFLADSGLNENPFDK
jgi:hypothetical protein